MQFLVKLFGSNILRYPITTILGLFYFLHIIFASSVVSIPVKMEYTSTLPVIKISEGETLALGSFEFNEYKLFEYDNRSGCRVNVSIVKQPDGILHGSLELPWKLDSECQNTSFSGTLKGEVCWQKSDTRAAFLGYPNPTTWDVCKFTYLVSKASNDLPIIPQTVKIISITIIFFIFILFFYSVERTFLKIEKHPLV